MTEELLGFGKNHIHIMVNTIQTMSNGDAQKYLASDGFIPVVEKKDYDKDMGIAQNLISELRAKIQEERAEGNKLANQLEQQLTEKEKEILKWQNEAKGNKDFLELANENYKVTVEEKDKQIKELDQQLLDNDKLIEKIKEKEKALELCFAKAAEDTKTVCEKEKQITELKERIKTNGNYIASLERTIQTLQLELKMWKPKDSTIIGFTHRADYQITKAAIKVRLHSLKTELKKERQSK